MGRKTQGRAYREKKRGVKSGLKKKKIQTTNKQMTKTDIKDNTLKIC